MAIILKTPQEIAKLRMAGRLVAETFGEIEKVIKPGIKLRQLDKLAEEYLKSRGAQTLYKGYRGNPPNSPPFPGVICASVNNEICHGFPNDRTLKDGDIVGIDIGLRYQGYCGDSCVTYAVGNIAPAATKLLEVTRRCMDLGIAAATNGAFLNDIGTAIEPHARANGYSVVREWGGHGLGRDLHEGPSVLHYKQPGRGIKLQPGMVFTVEPMINAGRHEWRLLRDGWTVVTSDGSLSAQFEHTIAITENGPEILSVL